MRHLTTLLILLFLSSFSLGQSTQKDEASKKPAFDRNTFVTGYSIANQFRSFRGINHGFVVKVVKHGKKQGNRQEIELEVAEVVGSDKSDTPFKTKATVYTHSRAGKVPQPSDKLYLIVVRPSNGRPIGAKAKLGSIDWVSATSQGTFHPVQSAQSDAISFLGFLLDETLRKKDRKKTLDRVFNALESDDYFMMGLAGGMIASNHIFGLIDAKKDDSADRLARFILSKADIQEIVPYFARLYYTNNAVDAIPRDGELIARMLRFPNTQLRSYFARCLGARDDRAKQLAGILGKYLLSKDLDPEGCKLALLAAGRWKDKAQLLLADAETLARGNGKQKALAFRALALNYVATHGGEETRNKLIVDLLTHTELATARYHAARLGLRQAVGAAIQAVRDKQFEWSDNLTQMCQVLTLRLNMTSWQQWNQWWTQAEATGQLGQFVDNGFTDEATNRRIAEMIIGLQSRKFVQRQQARKDLAGEPLHPNMPAIKRASVTGSAETRNSINGLLKRQQQKKDVIVQKLASQASQELRGR